MWVDFIPASHQYLLVVLSIWWAIGQLLGSLIAWPLIANFSCTGTTPATCPKSENKGWRYFMFTMGGLMLLLFVIRDHIGTTPLANLQATLTADLQRIWDSLSKPAELQDRQLADYFDLSFTALPHKVLVPEKFEDEVVKLRKRFTDKSNEGYLFKPAYHKRIPADGVAFYMENIWVGRTFDVLVYVRADRRAGTSANQ